MNSKTPGLGRDVLDNAGVKREVLRENGAMKDLLTPDEENMTQSDLATYLHTKHGLSKRQQVKIILVVTSRDLVSGSPFVTFTIVQKK